MAARLVWSGVGFLLTFIVIWQAEQLDRVRDGPRPSASATAGGADAPRRRSASVIAEGRLVTYPGAEVVLAAERPGRLVRVLVAEKSVVRKGDRIAELDSEDLSASRAEAEARIDEAEVEIRFHEHELDRSRGLVTRRAASTLELETNQKGFGMASARRRAALAARDLLDALIARTRITTPIDGVVIARFAHPGEMVAASDRLVAVADLTRVRIEAEVDEVDAGVIVPGADAVITAEGFPDRAWRGKVEEVPDSVVGRRLRPEDPSRPVDMRVLLVKIALAEPTPLKLGQRVEVEIAAAPRTGRPPTPPREAPGSP